MCRLLQLLIASETAQQVDSLEELGQFRQEGGMPRVLMALKPTPYTTKVKGSLGSARSSSFVATHLVLLFFAPPSLPLPPARPPAASSVRL